MCMYSYMLGLGYIVDLKDEYTDHVEKGYTIKIDMSLAFVSEVFD